MNPHPRAPKDFLFLGGHPAVDWVNTVVRTRNGPVEMLPDFETVLRWLVAARQLPPEMAHEARTRFGATDEAPALAARVRALREDLRVVLRQGPEPEPVARLDAIARLQPPFVWGLALAGRTPVRSPHWIVDSPERLLALFGAVTLDVLTRAPHVEVVACENAACGLLFVRSGIRTWCSDTLCGRRARSLRSYYQMRRGGLRW